ncbi:MAG: hypothetical protein ACOC2U_01035 [bacterium]
MSTENFNKIIILYSAFMEAGIYFEIDFYKQFEEINNIQTNITYDYIFYFLNDVKVWCCEEQENIGTDSQQRFNIWLNNERDENEWTDEDITIAAIFEKHCELWGMTAEINENLN